MAWAVPDLKPGDCLLYNTPGDFIDWVIRVKTWSRAAHCEGFVGNGMSVASRNGVGVNAYPWRRDGLIAVLRPRAGFDQARALAWFEKVKGQKYDFLGLLCFTLAVHRGSPDRMFCSEFLTRWYRAGGIDAMNPLWDSDKTAPGNFLMSPAFDWVWTAWNQWPRQRISRPAALWRARALLA